MSRIRQIAVFLSIFALIMAASHIYMFERIGYYLQLTHGQRLFTGWLLGLFAGLTLISLPLSRALPRRAASILAWIAYPWMGIALILFVALVATDILWLALQLISLDRAPDPLLQYDFGVVSLSLTAMACAAALWQGLALVRVRNLDVTIGRLPASFDGFRIVQITDLHIGPLIGGRWLRKIVNRVNALKPDMIVITGDLVDGSVAELSGHVAPLGNLRAPQGVYFITGNHEYYSGAEEWCAYVGKLGIRVLRNQRVSIRSAVAGDTFDLAGLNDWQGRSFADGGPDLPKALAGRDQTKPVILLAHQPAAVEQAASHGVDLQLSGHTHGGQIWPFTYLVYLQQPYTQGLFRYKNSDTQIYVSPGTGFWGPPMRLGTRAEITHITLRSGRA